MLFRSGAPAAASPGAGGFSFGAGPAAGSPSLVAGVDAVGAPAAASPGAGGFSFGAGAAAGSPSPAGAAAAIGASTAAAKPTAVRFSFLVYIFVLLLLVPSFFLMYISFQQCIFFRMIFKYVIVPAVSLSLFIFLEGYLSLFGVDWRVIFKQAEATELLYDAVQKGNQELIKTCIANGADTSRRQYGGGKRSCTCFFHVNVLYSVYFFPRPKSPGGDWLWEEYFYMCAGAVRVIVCSPIKFIYFSLHQTRVAERDTIFSSHSAF